MESRGHPGTRGWHVAKAREQQSTNHDIHLYNLILGHVKKHVREWTTSLHGATRTIRTCFFSGHLFPFELCGVVQFLEKNGQAVKLVSFLSYIQSFAEKNIGNLIQIVSHKLTFVQAQYPRKGRGDVAVQVPAKSSDLGLLGSNSNVLELFYAGTCTVKTRNPCMQRVVAA